MREKLNKFPLIRILAGTFSLLVIFSFSLIIVRDDGVSAQNSSTDLPHPKFALLVGISDYKNKQIPRLDGCENNIPLLAETLIGDYGFSENNVVSLLNEQATKEAIISKFRSHLTQNAKRAKEDGREAVIVYYFCGHGSQFEDQDNDENDGKDETFVSFDSRTEGVYDILDDELDDLKSELRSFTSNTTLILESCYSGTGSRGDFDDPKYIVHEIDGDKRKRPIYKRKFPPTTDADSLTYTEIAASLKDRTAKSESAEFCECDKPYSLMTKALVEGLKRATHTTTYRGLIREVSSEVAKRSIQDPQVEGNRDAILFGGAARRAKPYIEIEKILPNNQIAIRAGRIHGLNEGSQVSVYSSSSLTNTGNEGWLTNGVVNRVGNSLSVVELPKPEENPKVNAIKNTSHVVLASPVFGGGSVLVALNPKKSNSLSEAEKSLRTKIREKLTADDLVKNQVVKFVPSENVARSEAMKAKGLVRLKKGIVRDIFRDHMDKIKPILPKTSCDGNVLKEHSAETRFPGKNDEVYYLDDGESGGAPLYGRTFDVLEDNLAKKLSEVIKSFAYQQNLRGLDNANSTLSNLVRVTMQSIPEAAILESCQDGNKRHRRNGDKFKGFTDVKENRIPVHSYFTLTVKNISGEIRRKDDEFASGFNFHIAILGLTNDGEIKNMYGSKGANDPVIDGKEATVFLKTKEPIGIERYIVVISEDYVDFGFYELSLAKRNAKSILEQLLTRSGQNTRSSGLVIRDQPDSWDVINIDLQIVKGN